MALEIDGKNYDLLVNDEGLLLNLPVNPFSLKILQKAGYPKGSFLVGDLVLVEGRIP
jgi:hypothetical protein